MPIPAEGGLVKQYSAVFSSGTAANTVKSVYFTEDGTNTTMDRSMQLQEQGVAVFVSNPATDTDIIVSLFATVSIYGTDYEVKLGEFTVPASGEMGYAVGFGLIRKGLRIDLENAASPAADATVAVSVVPCNG